VCEPSYEALSELRLLATGPTNGAPQTCKDLSRTPGMRFVSKGDLNLKNRPKIAPAKQTSEPSATPEGECKNVDGWTDEKGWKCTSWEGYDCDKDCNYEQDAKDRLLQNCPVSCESCPKVAGPSENLQLTTSAGVPTSATFVNTHLCGRVADGPPAKPICDVLQIGASNAETAHTWLSEETGLTPFGFERVKGFYAGDNAGV